MLDAQPVGRASGSESPCLWASRRWYGRAERRFRGGGGGASRGGSGPGKKAAAPSRRNRVASGPYRGTAMTRADNHQLRNLTVAQKILRSFGLLVGLLLFFSAS